MDSLKKNKTAAGPDEWAVTEEQFQDAVEDLEDMGIDSDVATACAKKMLEILPLLQACLEEGDQDAARRLSLIVVPD